MAQVKKTSQTGRKFKGHKGSGGQVAKAKKATPLNHRDKSA